MNHIKDLAWLGLYINNFLFVLLGCIVGFDETVVSQKLKQFRQDYIKAIRAVFRGHLYGVFQLKV